MRRSLPLLLLAAAGAVLTRAQRQQRAYLGDLITDATQTATIAQQLQRQLITERRRADECEDEWRDTLGKLSRSRGEVARLEDLNRQLFAALGQRVISRDTAQNGGLWVWLPERHRPDGPFDRDEQARTHAEGLAALYPGQPVFVLGALDNVVYAAGVPQLLWEGDTTFHVPESPVHQAQGLG